MRIYLQARKKHQTNKQKIAPQNKHQRHEVNKFEKKVRNQQIKVITRYMVLHLGLEIFNGLIHKALF